MVVVNPPVVVLDLVRSRLVRLVASQLWDNRAG